VSADSKTYEQAIFTAGLSKHAHTYQGATRDVYRGGEGPAVLVLSEIPGITPPTLRLCERLMRAGYRVVVPQLFGDPGRGASLGAGLAALQKVCVSREFELLARNARSPITDWLASLARHEQHGDSKVGVGVIGMCLTGSFALAMMLEPAVVAPVMSQPSLPLPVSTSHRCALGVSDAEFLTIKRRFEREELTLLGLRFTADRLVPAQRFERLKRELGDRFVAVEIPSERGNAHALGPLSHSVLTEAYVDEPGHPTHAAFQEVLALFQRHLRRRSS